MPRRSAARIAALGAARSRRWWSATRTRCPRCCGALHVDAADHHRRRRLRQPLHRRSPERRPARAAAAQVLMARERLHGSLSTVEYFTFGFGTMIGVGWLVLMDDWLSRGGPGGGMLGFLIGGLLLFPIAHTYGRLVQRIQDAGAEIAYTEGVIPPSVSFAAGWTMVLSYAIVCPWEAVATGNLLARVFPALNSYQLYVIGGSADLRAAARGRPRADRADRRRQLPRHQAERHLPGRDDVRPARDVRDLHAARLRARVGGEHAAAVLAAGRRRRVAVDLPRAADRAVLHDRLRVGREGIGGGEGGLRSAQLHDGDLRRAHRRLSLLRASSSRSSPTSIRGRRSCRATCAPRSRSSGRSARTRSRS